MKQLLNTLFVTSEDVYLSLEQDNVTVLQEERKLARIPLRSIESIFCFSYKGASPSLMGKCADMGVGLHFYSPRGFYYCSILGESNRNVLLRMEQFRKSEDEERSLNIAKSFILAKVYNARWVLERAKRDHGMRVDVERLESAIGQLIEAMKAAESSVSLDELRGVEGSAAKVYFNVFDELILREKRDFYFVSRSRRPPLDRMNALMSFIYSLLTNDCTAALQGNGLDPYIGFMHVERPGRPALALDLMEELRPVLADRFALSLVNTGAVRPKDFDLQENGSVFLSESGRKKVLSAWQKRKAETITHPYLKESVSWGLVPYVQALLLARTVRGDLEQYPPFFWK
ncbi:type I-C CRISPR-associated endonuclease Cas1c [Bifidobacterium animalis]|uniref:type I-C CRISPR-associated endonuclease Cas1c n=1 Tax=Bifidobacterium animalis TaxID=28025 RepID=UPI003F8FC8B3